MCICVPRRSHSEQPLRIELRSDLGEMVKFQEASTRASDRVRTLGMWSGVMGESRVC